MGALLEHLNRRSAVAPWLIALGLVSACDTGEHTGVDGHLYFGSDNYLGEFDMRRGTSTVAANLGNLSIQQVGGFRDGEILLAVVASVGGRDTYKIVHFNPADNYLGTLYLGRRAYYLADVDAIVYDDGSRLFVRSVEGEFPRRELNARVSPMNRPDVVPVSGHAFLYHDIVAGSRRTLYYDVRTDTSRELPNLAGACELDAAVWVESLQQLMCRAQGDAGEGYVLVALDGSVGARASLPDGGFRAIGYLPDQRLVLLTRVTRSWFTNRPRFAVWIYDPELRQATRVSKDQYLGDTVAYRRTNR